MNDNENYDDSYQEDSSYNEDSDYEEYEPSEEYVDDSAVENQQTVSREDMQEFFETVENPEVINESSGDIKEPDYFDEQADSGFLNFDDPFTGKKIQTQRDQHEFLTKYTEAVLRNAGLPSSYLDYRIKNHPAVLLANKVKEKYEIELSNQKFLNELNELKEIVPEVNKMEDLFKIRNFKNFFGYYYGKIKVDKNGNPVGDPKPKMSMKEAYLLANYDTVVKNKTKASKQSVINNFMSKSHLSTTQNNKNAYSNAEIPAETLDLYKHLLPNLKMKDYLKHFNKTNNN